MIYEFTCIECGGKQDISIPTWDLHNKTKHSLGIDMDALDKRLKEERRCECGGLLKKNLTPLGKPMFAKVDRQRFA